MVGPSLNTHHNLTLKPTITPLKFLCSYGGKILPRYPDGKLRYQGGETRLLAVHRSISFPELLVKLGELCGSSVSLRCQLPTEDLDALISITSDEDLSNLIEEYDRAATAAASPPPSSNALKIRAFLFPPKKIFPPPSTAASSSSSLNRASPIAPVAGYASATKFPAAAAAHRCIHPISKYKPVAHDQYPLCYGKISQYYICSSSWKP